MHLWFKIKREKELGDVVRKVVNEQMQAITVSVAEPTMNKHFNFDLKIQKLQPKLDSRKARNLTLFGKGFDH